MTGKSLHGANRTRFTAGASAVGGGSRVGVVVTTARARGRGRAIAVVAQQPHRAQH